jgi:hypothetical protein
VRELSSPHDVTLGTSACIFCVLNPHCLFVLFLVRCDSLDTAWGQVTSPCTHTSISMYTCMPHVHLVFFCGPLSAHQNLKMNVNLIGAHEFFVGAAKNRLNLGMSSDEGGPAVADAAPQQMSLFQVRSCSAYSHLCLPCPARTCSGLGSVCMVGEKICMREREEIAIALTRSRARSMSLQCHSRSPHALQPAPDRTWRHLHALLCNQMLVSARTLSLGVFPCHLLTDVHNGRALLHGMHLGVACAGGGCRASRSRTSSSTQRC